MYSFFFFCFVEVLSNIIYDTPEAETLRRKKWVMDLSTRNSSFFFFFTIVLSPTQISDSIANLTRARENYGEGFLFRLKKKIS